MYRWRYVLSFLLICSLCLSSCSAALSDELPTREEEVQETPVQAMWISQFDLAPICTMEGKQRPEADFIRRAEQMMDNINSLGINTLFIQVRPNGDSMYPSAYFPMSPYAVGTIGATPDYDPFAILLMLARDRNLSVHAWINPLRCFTEANRQLLTVSCPLLAWSEHPDTKNDLLVLVENTWYLNPARQEALDLILLGVREILGRYKVDGIHIDDYFYPTTEESFDRAAYEEYLRLGGTDSLGDFRRENVNRLVSGLYRTVKELDPCLQFGVSPGGNVSRNYTQLYADPAAWCAQPAAVDYLCPQIYFGWEHETCPFDKTCQTFWNMTRNSSVQLIVGMTLGKAYEGYHGREDPYAGTGKREWIERKDILRRSTAYVSALSSDIGVAYFSYQYFFSPQTGLPVEATEEERSCFLPLPS